MAIILLSNKKGFTERVDSIVSISSHDLILVANVDVMMGLKPSHYPIFQIAISSWYNSLIHSSVRSLTAFSNACMHASSQSSWEFLTCSLTEAKWCRRPLIDGLDMVFNIFFFAYNAAEETQSEPGRTSRDQNLNSNGVRNHCTQQTPPDEVALDTPTQPSML